MWVFNNITDGVHKKELAKMIKDHYREIYGEKTNKMNIFQRIKDRRSFSTFATDSDMKELFEKPLYGTVAYGIMNDKDNTIIGFILLDILNTSRKNLEIETYGQLYQLYIKPEYRYSGRKQDKLITSIDKFINKYFSSKEVTEIVMAIPESVPYLIDYASKLGFTIAKKSSKEYGINKSIWKKKI